MMSNEADTKKREEAIKKSLYFSYIFALIILLITISLAFSGHLRPIGELPHEWFQRSGSVIAILSVFLELRIFNMWKMLNQIHDIDGVGSNELAKKYSNHYNSLNLILIILVIAGAVVWGYGDLIYLALIKA